jgi:ankyrin repeat protein
MEERMNKALPERPDLGQLKKQAKDLLQAWSRSESLDRLTAHPNPPREPKLADAQFVLAREYGFASWPQLKRHVEIAAADTPAARFIEAACVKAVGHHSRPSLETAEAQRAKAPAVTHEDFACACAYGEADAVRRFLAADPGLARQKVGHRQWEPMLYLCFSGYAAHGSPRQASVLEAVRVLLSAGADPNPSFLSDPDDPGSIEPAIYGAAGIANNADLSRLLVEAGADPNDGETPYHVPEFRDGETFAMKELWPLLNPDSRATVMLRLCDYHNYGSLEWCLQHGGDPNHPGQWKTQILHQSIRRLNGLRYQELIVRHGGDVNGKTEDRQSGEVQSVYQMAALRGRQDVIELITAHGAVDDLTETQRFVYALATADSATARSMLAASPDLVARLDPEESLAMNAAAGQGNVEAVRLMIELGLPLHRPGINGDTPLHYAASMGHLPVVELLLEAGAPVDARQMQGLTPLQLAQDFLRNGWVTKPEMQTIIDRLAEAEAD